MSKETIHSGHFMTSNPHTEIQGEDGEDDEDVEVDVVDVEDGVNGSRGEQGTVTTNASNKGEKPVTYYKFGPHKAQSIAIDVSLNKLNKCIKVAYMKMTTPKWKDFKGLKLQWKHRIRLNNVIWRAYYMEFGYGRPNKKRRTPFCYFSVPDDDMTHSKLEGSVLEGMYWKRRMEAVCAQYKRWRGFNRHSKKKALRACCRKRENSCVCDKNAVQVPRPPQSQTPTGRAYSTLDDLFDMDDDFDNEFTNQLFESLNGPFLFPNPRDLKDGGSAGSMLGLGIYEQPGLLSLQPSIEEIMSTSDYYFPDNFENSGNATMVDNGVTGSQSAASSMDGGYGVESMREPLPMPEQTKQVTRPRPPPQNGTNNQQQQLYSAKEYDAAMQLAVGFDNGGPTQQRQPPLYSQASQYDHRPSVLTPTARKTGVVGVSPVATSSPASTLSSNLSASTAANTLLNSLDNYMPRILAAVTGVPTSTGMHSFNSSPAINFHYQPTQRMDGNEWLLNNLQQHQHQQQAQRELTRPADKFLSPNSIIGLTSPVPTPSAIQTTTNHHRRHAQQPLPSTTAANNHHYGLPQPARTPATTSNSIFPQVQRVGMAPTSEIGKSGGDLLRYLPHTGSAGGPLPTPSISLASMIQHSPFSTASIAPVSTTAAQNSQLYSVVQQQQQRAPSGVGNGGKLANSLLSHHQQLPPVHPIKSSQVFITRNLITTSSAGPTAPSSSVGHIYSNNQPLSASTSSFLPFFKATSPSPTRSNGKLGAFRFPSVDSAVSLSSSTQPSSVESLFAPLTSAPTALQHRPSLSSPLSAGTRLTRTSTEGISKAGTKRKLSASAASKTATSVPVYTPLTPPSQYTEMSNLGASSSPDAAMDLSSPSSGGTLAGSSSTPTNLHIDSPSNLLPLSGRIVIKEEQEDSKPLGLKSLTPSSSKRRNTSSSGSKASSRAAADSTLHPEERKRILHLHAEKNRRSALKEGFESLVDAIPVMEQAGVKSTNAVVLNRAAVYIKDLKDESEEKARQVEEMKEKIERTKEKISTIQSNLPSNSRLTSSSASAPSTRCQLEQFFEHYSKERARQDYRFWMMSEIFQRLVKSFAANVHSDASNREEVLASTRRWLDGSWNSANLRPACTETLVKLATASGAINDDSSLPKYILGEISKNSSNSSSSS